ncbi:voltage-gated hydrogen channel 1-like [Watersipora subatra]|uniref:voltage-gated hydrogen channel 1-like n=1 Tax=Watersipora subatra TaxID=2589382 RepID=UPI00355BC4A5
MGQILQDSSLSEMKEPVDHLQLSHSSALAGKRFHEKVDFYLHRPIVEYVVIFLIIVDALLVTASLLIEIRVIETLAKESASSGLEVRSDEVVRLEHTGEALHYTSLAILTLFMIEVLLKLYGQRVKFFKRKIQVVDSFVVAISFALDIAVIIVGDVDSTLMQGLGLIVVLRLWRLVRIVNGAVVATKEQLDVKIHEAKTEAREAKERAQELEMLMGERDREIEFLKGRLGKYEPIEMIPTGSTRLPAYLPETREFPKQVLGDVTDDEDYRMGFSDMQAASRPKPRPAINSAATAFQAYQPGATYQVTSQYPESSKAPYRAGANKSPYRTPLDYHTNDLVDTADESDVVSIKPSKARSGNTFTVKKDGVPMTSL